MVVQWKSDGILSFIADQLTTISPLLNNEAHPTINPPILTSGLVIWEIASVSAQVRETDSHHKLVGWSELSPPLLVPRCARSFLADTHCGSMALHLSSNISAPEAEHQTISDPPHFLWGDPWKWWVNMMKKHVWSKWYKWFGELWSTWSRVVAEKPLEKNDLGKVALASWGTQPSQ